VSKEKTRRIYVGVGGWTYEPWRASFFPVGLPHKRELEFASRKLTSIEINGTYYRSQTPKTFAKWRDETPAGFVFSVKAPRFATNRRVLAEAGQSIEKFFNSGVMELNEKLGPINWQFMPTKKFDSDDFGAFLELLPKHLDGRPLRHAIEVRHDSFRTPKLISLARAHKVAIVIAGDSHFPQIADLTAPFVYARIMGTSEREETGYSSHALDQWAKRARLWSSGGEPKDLQTVSSSKKESEARDVYLYVISGYKARNPASAMALIERLAH
jgi:uncharacterized protein YecE (DUF72 family)